jgi:hypothetical protein
VRCSMASCGSEDWSTVGRRIAIRRITPATGRFSSGSAAACCGASSKSSLRHCTTKATWICRSVHRWERRARQAEGARVGKTKRGKGSKIMAIADRKGLPSPSTWRAPRRTKSHLCTPHSRTDLSISCRCVSSATTSTSRTGWTRNWRAVAWSGSRHTGGPEHSERKTVARCVAINGGGRSSASLLGSRTSVDREKLTLLNVPEKVAQLRRGPWQQYWLAHKMSAASLAAVGRPVRAR